MATKYHAPGRKLHATEWGQRFFLFLLFHSFSEWTPTCTTCLWMKSFLNKFHSNSARLFQFSLHPTNAHFHWIAIMTFPFSSASLSQQTKSTWLMMRWGEYRTATTIQFHRSKKMAKEFLSFEFFVSSRSNELLVNGGCSVVFVLNMFQGKHSKISIFARDFCCFLPEYNNSPNALISSNIKIHIFRNLDFKQMNFPQWQLYDSISS